MNCHLHLFITMNGVNLVSYRSRYCDLQRYKRKAVPYLYKYLEFQHHNLIVCVDAWRIQLALEIEPGTGLIYNYLYHLKSQKWKVIQPPPCSVEDVWGTSSDSALWLCESDTICHIKQRTPEGWWMPCCSQCSYLSPVPLTLGGHGLFLVEFNFEQNEPLRGQHPLIIPSNRCRWLLYFKKNFTNPISACTPI